MKREGLEVPEDYRSNFFFFQRVAVILIPHMALTTKKGYGDSVYAHLHYRQFPAQLWSSNVAVLFLDYPYQLSFLCSADLPALRLYNRSQQGNVDS